MTLEELMRNSWSYVKPCDCAGDGNSGSSNGSQKSVNIIDSATGKNYKLTVNNGVLTMSEVINE